MLPLRLLRAPCSGVTISSVLLLAACGGSSAATGSETTTTPSGTDALAPYYIATAICSNTNSPDCTKLPLGNTSLTLSTPGAGKLYSCMAGNPNAGGSIAARITWIDSTASTWNLTKKPFLPSGTFAPGAGTFSQNVVGGTLTLTSNNLPVDGQIGDWPMSRYAVLTAIDGNPGTPAPRAITFTLPAAPTVNITPTCVGMGMIGVTANGVVLYNAADGRGNDAVANEIVDKFGGHPAQVEYHYHFVPERLDSGVNTDGHSKAIGWIRDGFQIYGYKGVGGATIRNADLDQCHGHSHGPYGYHYHATLEYPYTVGCYRGTPR
jgi:hypothetical protein